MPIDQLPTEILTLILEFVCTQNLLQEYQPGPKGALPGIPPTTLCSPLITNLPALAVSAICARWRALSLALSGLWAHLKLEIIETTTASNGIMATLQLYLERSAEAPLHLDVFIGFCENVNPPPLDLLLQHTARWKTFQCIADLNMSKTPLSLPVLENLTLQWGHRWACSDIFHCFQHVPMLRAFDISGDSYIKEDFLPKLPQSQLTTLIMPYLPYPKLHKVIGDLQNLITLELSVDCEEQPRDLSILLAQLRSFTLSLECLGLVDDEVVDWFHIFTFPSLDKLVISRSMGERWEFTWSVHAFSDFLSRSSCTLTHLSINGIAISDLDFITALHLLPSLTTLGFDDCHIEEKKLTAEYPRSCDFGVKNPITSFFLSNLTFRELGVDFEPVVVPKLQSLSIKLKGTSFDDASFVEMVLSRWIPDLPHAAATRVASLRSLVLRLHERSVDEDVYRPLFELDKVGMRWGREVKEEENLRPLGNLKRMGMRVIITGKECILN